MTAATITIISLNYKESMQAITETSLITTRQIGMGTIQNLNSLFKGIEMLSIATTSLISSPSDISGSNDSLANYLLSTLVQNYLIATIHIASMNGDLISASNITLTGQLQYRFDITKNLPEGVRYAITTISHSNNKIVEEWKYLDTDFKIQGSEKNSPPSIDPRVEPWFTEVAEWPRIAWTEPYNIAPNTIGLSFATPIIIDNKLIGVAATNLTLASLSQVISDTVIGKTGSAFVLNSFGEIILPQVLTGSMPYIIEDGYNIYSKTNQKDFVLNEGDTPYVLEVFVFALDVNTIWNVLTIVPLSDFFDPILKSDIHSIQIGFFILLLATILIYWASGKIARPINQLAGEVKKINDFNFSEVVPVHSNIYEVSLLSSSIQTMRRAFASFTKYVPKEIVKKLVKEGQEIAIGGERRTMTILFSDIENFTTVTESLSVEQITTTLTEYFEVFTKIIIANDGNIDKYIGDSVMAIWNAPNFVPNHAEKACEACLSFLAYIKDSTQTNPFLKGHTRFGINTGEVIVGNIGTTERISYTAIGTPVNTAARFQNLNKNYHVSIIIGEAVRESLSARFITRPLDLLAVKGRNQPIQIFELMGITEGEPKTFILTKEQLELARDFTAAFDLFHQGKLAESKEKFTAISQKFPDDEPTKIHLSRLNT